jgi:hypothetical protein
MATARRVLVLVAAATGVAAAAGAQAPAGGSQRGAWRLGASTGGYAPRSAVILGADGSNTRLGAGPAFSLDVQYPASRYLSVYANGTMAFSTITFGTSIRPSVVGPSNQVLVMGGTAGVLLSAPGSGGSGTHLQPTLRVGGGLKGYSFNLTDAQTQWRPTGDIGLGFRGVGSGPIEVTAEVRYLPSSFDQSKLPIRGIVPQKQRQNDLAFGVGIAVRP